MWKKNPGLTAVSKTDGSCLRVLLVQHCPAEPNAVIEMIYLIFRLTMASVTKEPDFIVMVANGCHTSAVPSGRGR